MYPCLFFSLFISGLCQWDWVGLYCHPGPAAEYLSGLLADGVGAGNCDHSHGDSRGGEYSVFLGLTGWRSVPGRVGASSLQAGRLCEVALYVVHTALFWLLLSLQEGGREKSFRYWPRLGSRHNTVTYGRFKITTRFRTDSGCYATTGLKMKHLLTGQERTVWHLQYTDWPEHGCPEDLKGFLCKCVLLVVQVAQRKDWFPQLFSSSCPLEP